MKKNNLLSITIVILFGQAQLIADVALFVPSFTNMDYYSEEYKKCYNDPNWNTASLSICMGEEIDRQDALLNKSYKRMISFLSDDRKKALKDAQRAWIKYRDANCNWYNDPDGGTSAGISAQQCYLNMTVSRLTEMDTEGFSG